MLPNTSLTLRLPNISYGILKVLRIYNYPFLIRSDRKVLGKDTPTLTMDIVWTLSNACPVSCFGSNNSMICWRSKKQKSVATSIYEAEYIGLARATKQWIWLPNAAEELKVPGTHAAMFCDNKAAIDITYNHKIVDRSKHIDVAYYLVHKNIESRKICLFQVELGERLANIYANGLPQVTRRKLRTEIMDVY
jgi:hypothetical protein